MEEQEIVAGRHCWDGVLCDVNLVVPTVIMTRSHQDELVNLAITDQIH